ncbi:MerR family DNA-binding transcriptional regulator [Candidatus Acetothermia bacterium]|nr:MAG: MerR family DNA-binding transcriptional regulator [Candidatus Acetothermia bacterium]
MYLTIPELARRVGVHRSTVYRWVRSGRLKPEAVVTRRSIFLLAPSAVAEAQRIRSRNGRRKKSAIK